jgi:hypothetical protein
MQFASPRLYIDQCLQDRYLPGDIVITFTTDRGFVPALVLHLDEFDAFRASSVEATVLKLDATGAAKLRVSVSYFRIAVR